MFNGKPTYLMEIDAQVCIPPGVRDRLSELAQLSDDDLVFVLVVSLEEQVMGAAVEELSRGGLRPTKRMKGNGHVRRSGAEYVQNRLGEHHVRFRVAFEGDHDRAVAAAGAWAARLETFDGIESIDRLSLRGTDGTSLFWFDGATREAVGSEHPGTATRIYELLDPVASPA